MISVSAWIIHYEDIAGLEFEYLDTAGRGTVRSKFGICGPFSSKDSRIWPSFAEPGRRKLNHKVRFEIQGPGGEIIKSVHWDKIENEYRSSFAMKVLNPPVDSLISLPASNTFLDLYQLGSLSCISTRRIPIKGACSPTVDNDYWILWSICKFHTP